jgi:ubiquinone/menaquinone biosynthesis C-methylase UbiE
MAWEALKAAAAVWNRTDESLEWVERRIHDNVPPEKLHERGDGYVRNIFSRFPYVKPQEGWRILEVGSGVGYIMQAMARRLEAEKIHNYEIAGLDIAENMLARARERLGSGPYEFIHYDGLHVPQPDASFDFIYSVASLQHVPKIYVYNLFFEMKRLLKPKGFAVLHLLPFHMLPHHIQVTPWREEIDWQLNNMTDRHWHHFYSQDELVYVLRDGTGFNHVDIHGDGEWVCFGTAPPKSLPFWRKRFLRG